MFKFPRSVFDETAILGVQKEVKIDWQQSKCNQCAGVRLNGESQGCMVAVKVICDSK